MVDFIIETIGVLLYDMIVKSFVSFSPFSLRFYLHSLSLKLIMGYYYSTIVIRHPHGCCIAA